MATSIFHGEPGSYKTSTAIWFTILPALREGRLVVTNIAGMKQLETFERELNETFPEGAQLWRISSQNKEGIELLQNFYNWMPIGALFVLDEVQGIYPNDRTFKPELLGRHKPETFEHLPKEYIAEFYHRLDLIKSEELEEGDTDDLGTAMFDENGHIIYPADLREAFMRHRHFNWDIVVCTPEISEVHKLLRSVAQNAYSHRSCDDIGRLIPYYKRRPRIFPHKPTSNGQTIKKGDTYFHRKVPVKVHDFYKSTATGVFNEEGNGRTPLQDPKVLASFILVLLCLFYWIYFIASKLSDDVPDEVTQEQGTETIFQSVGKTVDTTGGVTANAQADKSYPNFADNVGLPYRSTEVYVSGIFDIYTQNRFFKRRDYVFNLVSGEHHYSMTGEQLIELGFEIEYKSECLVYLKSSKSLFTALCPPNEIRDNEALARTGKPSISII